ncbi:prefoldin alpha subunit [Methanohalophilus levihalophilus]|uniref:prefoldin subunit alpha n=1 Tax=Methanohalophilus levihalophilus TaxID=1431282 RepID=UPI001AEA7D55|nr:prefoldin subunit alpha [Methanohalophilus levihalophilus]MBP2031227.1 prefoldin alpha subunit [Methanohalophilus levihalophilus]
MAEIGQQDIQNLAMQHREYQQQAQTIQQQISMVQVSIDECKMAINTLDELPDEPELESLIPIGSGSFLNARVLNNDKVVVDVGAGFRVEKSAEGAKEILNKRCDNFQKILDNMTQSLSRIAEKMQSIESLVAQQQGGVPPQ